MKSTAAARWRSAPPRCGPSPRRPTQPPLTFVSALVSRRMFEVQAVAPGVFRVGMFGDGRPADYSSPAIAGGAPVDATRHEDRLETPFGTARWADDRIWFEDPDG